MKKTTFILFVAILVSACNDVQNGKKAERERDSLQVIVGQRDSTLNDLLASFNGIERTLDSINIRQRSIYIMTAKPLELKGSIIQAINEDIKAINDLLEKNKKDITRLNSAVKAANGRNQYLDELVKTLNSQLDKKQNDLADLNRQLIGLNAEIFQLESTIGFITTKNNIQAEIIGNEIAILHKAYYLVGTAKDLMKDKIIDKKGGLLGIGRTKELNAGFDTTKFTKIDYTQTLFIPLECKKIEIITSHPPASYKLEKNNNMIKALHITNSEEFWRTSKYLVIIKSES